MEAYCEKLYEHASFVIVEIGSKIVGFTAFYKNMDANQLYISLICVDPEQQGNGIGGEMLSCIHELKAEGYQTIALEVNKSNRSAYHFYKKHSFKEQEDRGEKFLMHKII